MCPENPLQNGFSFLTEWFVLVPKNYDVFNIEMAKSSQTHFLLQNGIPDPIFFHRMEAYTGINPTRGGNGKGDHKSSLYSFRFWRNPPEDLLPSPQPWLEGIAPGQLRRLASRFQETLTVCIGKPMKTLISKC